MGDPDHPDVRKVVVADGFPKGKRCLIVDDLVQSGGTLHECGKKLLEEGAENVSAFVVHSIFPKESWRRFCSGGDRNIFKFFFTTNSNRAITDSLPKEDVFTILDLTPQIYHDL